MIESKLFDKYDSMKAFIFTVGNENLLVKDCDRKTEDGTFDWVCGIKFYIHTDIERKLKVRRYWFRIQSWVLIVWF